MASSKHVHMLQTHFRNAVLLEQGLAQAAVPLEQGLAQAAVPLEQGLAQALFAYFLAPNGSIVSCPNSTNGLGGHFLLWNHSHK